MMTHRTARHACAGYWRRGTGKKKRSNTSRARRPRHSPGALQGALEHRPGPVPPLALRAASVCGPALSPSSGLRSLRFSVAGYSVPVIAVGERCALNCFFPRPPTCSGPATARLVCRPVPLRVCSGGRRPASPGLRLVAAQPVWFPRPCFRAALAPLSRGLGPGARPACFPPVCLVRWVAACRPAAVAFSQGRRRNRIPPLSPRAQNAPDALSGGSRAGVTAGCPSLPFAFARRFSAATLRQPAPGRRTRVSACSIGA